MSNKNIDVYRDPRWMKITKARRQYYRDEGIYPICHLCSEVIDPYISGRSKWGLVFDHIVSLRNGGMPFHESNIGDAHSSCNGQKAAGIDSSLIHGPSYVETAPVSITPPRHEPEPVRVSRCWGNPQCHGRTHGCAECEARYQHSLAYDKAHSTN